MFTHIKALDWLELKSVVVQNPLVVSPDTTVLDAIRLMARYTIAQINSGRSASAIESQVSEEHLEAQSSCVVVVENDLVVGILTTSDVKILRNQQEPLARLLVRQVMTHPAIALREEAFTDLGSAINLLLEHDIDHLPILDRQDRLVGIVTQESLLPALNPLELYKQGQVLQQKLQSLEAENSILLESHTAELERGVEARTAALQTKREGEKLVAQIAKRIRNSLNLQEILDICVVEVRAFLECDRALVYQFQPDRSGIIIAESVKRGWSSTLGNHVQDIYVGQGIATYYNCEQPIVVNNIYTADYSDCHIQLLESYQIKANLIVPIWVAGQLWGLLVGHQCGEYRDWQQDDITLLQDISVQLEIAIQQATTHQQLQQELVERRQAEQRYAFLAEAALVGIFRTDAEGNCIYVNNRYFEITGLTRETAFGKEWQKALHPEDRERVMTECYQSVQENRPFQLEYRFLRPDGTVRWVYGQSVPERDTNGLIVGHVGNITDITAQKRSVEALQRSEAHQRALVSAIPDLITRINRAGIYLEFVASPNFRVLVNNLADWVGSHVCETLPPELGQKRMEFIELALQTNTIQSYQQELDFDGTIQIEEIRIVPYSEDEVLLLVRDITTRKQAEKALEASQQTLSTLISNLPGFVYRIQNDRDYTAEFVSSGVEDITGYHPDEYLIERSRSLSQDIHPDDANVVWQIVQKAVADRESYECEYRIITKTGAQKWVWERGQGIYYQNNELLFLEGFVTDITDRRRIETALKKAENQYREAQRIAHLGYWEYDLTTDTSYWSDEVFRIFGIERHTLAPNYLQFFNLVHPDDREMVKECYIRHLYDGTPYNVVHRYLMPDGQLKYVQQECETIYAADGTPILSQGTVQDITSQQLAQLELERLNARLETIVAERTQRLWQVNNLQRAILNSTDYAIVSTDLTGTIETFNAGAERMLGYRAKEVVGKLNPFIFHDPAELSQQAGILSVEQGQNISWDLEAFVAKARQSTVSEAEWTLIRKDGSRFPGLLTLTALKNAHQEIIGFLGIAKDISEQKQSQIERQQLLQELSAFKLALDQSAVVSITNTQGAIEYVNDRFCETFGYSREQLIGQNHTIVGSGYHSPSFIQELWDTITSGEIWRGEISYQAKNGSLYWFASTIVPFLDEQGQPFQYLGIHFDITARKLVKAKLRQENTFRQQILENMAEGLCVCHDIAEFPFIRFTVWNPQMLAITGYSLEEINCLGWYQILYPDSEVQAQAIARIERMRQGDRLIAEEWEIQRQDGSKRTIAISTSTLLSNDGQTHTLALIQDITDRKTAEKLLQDREARYHGLMEAASDAIMLTDEQGNLIEVNRKAEELLGYTAAELTSMHFTKLHRFEELPRLTSAFEGLTEQKYCQVFDINFRCKDGHVVPADVSASLIEIQGEKIIQYIFRDISERQAALRERKRAEAALQESETRFRRVFESNIIGMIFTDFSGQISEANDCFLEMLGYSREELKANQVNWAAMTPPEYHLSDLKVIEDLKRDGVLTPVEKAYYHKDGHQVPVLIGAALLDSGDNGNCVCVVLDISEQQAALRERKRTEIALRESQQFLQTVLDSFPQAVFWKDRNSVYLGCNQVYAQVAGLASPLEVVGKTDFDFAFKEAEVIGFIADDREVIESGVAKLGIEEAITLYTGEQRWLETNKIPLRDLAGNAIAVVGTFQDITERKQAELALAQYTSEIEDLYNNAPCGYHSLDPEGRFIRVNETELKLLGYSREEIIGNSVIHFFTEASREAFRKNFPVFQAQGWMKNMEFEMICKDGTILPVMISATAVKDSEGNYLYSRTTLVDIRDRKQAEQQIRALAERETLLREITQRIRRSLDLPTIFNTAVQEIRYFLRADRVGIFQFDPDSDCDDGEFVSESVTPGLMSVLEIRIHDHCFKEQFAALYQQGRFQAIDNIDNANLEDCYRAVLLQLQIRANLILPLLKKDKLWGLLCIHQCSGPRKWQSTEISFIQEIANQLTIAIHQASLYEQIQLELKIRKQAETALALQLKQQQTLGAIAQQIRQSLNLEEILSLVTQQVKDLLKTDRVIVFRLFPDGRSQIIAEAVNSEFVALKERHWANETWPQDILDCYWQGQPRIVPDVMNDIWTHCLVPYSLQGQIQSKIVAPILQEIHKSETHRWVAPGKNNKLWGVLVVHACREKRVWQESEAQILQQIANQLAIAIQQANLFEQLQLELTSRQLAQQQLVESNQQLAISNQELARATRLKDEFLANMSHELRTPLNSILGMTEGLQEQIFGSINEQQIRALKTIESSGSHLLELINDILDVAKIESGQLQLDCTPTSIASLCQSSLTFIKQLALKKHIQLEIKIPRHLPDLLLDERRIRQVLINLLNNAVKFTPEGGHITLEVSLMTQQGDGERRDGENCSSTPPTPLPPHPPTSSSSLPQSYLRIAIADTGIGIEQENINKLFQPFVQIDSALNRQYAGTGLGLALVKRLVQLHGGQVGVSSELGVGSCFTIDLPYIATDFSALASVVQPQLYIEPQELEQGGAPLILLVEDNEANLSTISNYLRAKGYLVVVAKNGEQAIACVQSENPDLILMDIQMPGMDGLEAIQHIRNNLNYVDVPIIALTALAMTGDRDRCLAAGANDYLTKPVKLKQLVMSMQQLLVSRSR